MNIEIILAISAFFLIVPVLITRWLWYWVFSFVFGSPIIAIWVAHFYQISRPEYSGSPGEALGNLIMILVSGSLFTGMFLRYIRWVIELIIQEIKESKSANSGNCVRKI